MKNKLKSSYKFLFSSAELGLFCLAVLCGGVLLYSGNALADPLPRSNNKISLLHNTGFPPDQYKVMANLPLAEVNWLEAETVFAQAGMDWFYELPNEPNHKYWMKTDLERVAQGYDVGYPWDKYTAQPRNIAFYTMMQWGQSTNEFVDEAKPILQRIMDWIQSVFQKKAANPPMPKPSLVEQMMEWIRSMFKKPAMAATAEYNIFTTDSILCDQAEWLAQFAAQQDMFKSYKAMYLSAVHFFHRVSEWHIRINEIAESSCGSLAEERLQTALKAGNVGEPGSPSWDKAYQSQKQSCIDNFTTWQAQNRLGIDQKKEVLAIAKSYWKALNTLQEDFAKYQDQVIPAKPEVVAAYLAQKACPNKSFANGHFLIEYTSPVTGTFWNITHLPYTHSVYSLNDITKPEPSRNFTSRLSYSMLRNFPLSSEAPKQSALDKRLAAFGLTQADLTNLDTISGSNLLSGGPANDWAWGGLNKLF